MRFILDTTNKQIVVLQANELKIKSGFKYGDVLFTSHEVKSRTRLVQVRLDKSFQTLVFKTLVAAKVAFNEIKAANEYVQERFKSAKPESLIIRNDAEKIALLELTVLGANDIFSRTHSISIQLSRQAFIDTHSQVREYFNLYPTTSKAYRLVDNFFNDRHSWSGKLPAYLYDEDNDMRRIPDYKSGEYPDYNEVMNVMEMFLDSLSCNDFIFIERVDMIFEEQ